MHEIKRIVHNELMSLYETQIEVAQEGDMQDAEGRGAIGTRADGHKRG